MANFCPKCGKEVNLSDKFCKNCGATLIESAKVPKEELKQPIKNHEFVASNKPPAPVQTPTEPSEVQHTIKEAIIYLILAAIVFFALYRLAFG